MILVALLFMPMGDNYLVPAILAGAAAIFYAGAIAVEFGMARSNANKIISSKLDKISINDMNRAVKQISSMGTTRPGSCDYLLEKEEQGWDGMYEIRPAR